MTARPEIETRTFASAEDWEAWLEENHAVSDGLWIKFAKKGTSIESVYYPEALDAALCYGWIDGQTRRFDDEYYLQRFTPRRKRSKWSKINREKVATLIEAGRVKPAGLREIERAKADGRWNAAYDSPSTATVPDDLQSRFDENPEAAAFFATLNSTNRYAILYQIQDAKKPETRVRRIEKYVAMLNSREKPYP